MHLVQYGEVWLNNLPLYPWINYCSICYSCAKSSEQSQKSRVNLFTINENLNLTYIQLILQPTSLPAYVHDYNRFWN